MLFLLLFSFYLGHSQLSQKWTKTYNNSKGTHPFDIAVKAVGDNIGNTYALTTGYSSDYNNSSSQKPNYIINCSLLKYDVNGGLVFSKVLTYSDFLVPKDIAVDQSGFVYALFLYNSASGTKTFLTVKYDAAGNELWQQQYVATQDPLKLMVDHSNCVVAVGYAQIVKYSGAGIFKWSKTLNSGSHAINMAIDSVNSVYIAGGKSSDLYTAKYDSNGVFSWQTSLNGSGNGNDEAQAMGIDRFGNIYTAGYLYSTTDYEDFALVKYRQNGDTAWKRTYHLSTYIRDTAKCMAIDNNGNIYVSGNNGANIITLKYDSLGTLKWPASYYASTGSPYMMPTSILFDNNAVYVTGCAPATNINGVGGYDMIFLKYDATFGGLSWSKKNTGTEPNYRDFGKGMSVHKDAGGNYVVGGYVQNAYTHSDFKLVKYDALGNTLYDITYDGPGTSSDISRSARMNSHGEIIVAVATQDSTMYNGTLNSNMRYNSVAYIKYDSLGNKVWENLVHFQSVFDIRANDMIIDGSDNLVSLVSNELAGAEKMMLVKIDNSGALVWQKTYNLSGFSGIEIKQDNSGNFIIGSKGSDGLIAKCNSLGDTLWTMRNTSGYGTMSDIDVDGSGNIYTSHGDPSQGGVISRYSASGALTWSTGAANTGLSMYASIKVDQQNNLVAMSAGHNYSPDRAFSTIAKINPSGSVVFTDTVQIQRTGVYIDYNFLPQILTDSLSNIYSTHTYVTPSLNTYETVVAKRSATGALLWRKTVTSNVYTAVTSNCVDENDSYLIGGLRHTSSTNGRMLYQVNVSGAKKDSLLHTDSNLDPRITQLVPYKGLLYVVSTDNRDVMISCFKNPLGPVWPGDANSDGTADNTDILELGLHYTQTGPARASVSNAWQPYQAMDWAGTITNGQNLNHSDCNGDGIIDDNDTLAIYNNYGLVHAFKASNTTTLNPQLSIVPDQGMVNTGQWGTASIYLGSSSAPINNINGIAFSVNFDHTLIEPNSIYLEYPVSFINATNHNLHFRKTDFNNDVIYTATTHTLSANVSGYGKIAILHYRIKTTLTQDAVLNIGVSQADQSNASGTLSPLTTGNATLMAIGATVGIDEATSGDTAIYPNPAASVLNITSSLELQKAELTDVTGHIVMSEKLTGRNGQLQLSGLANGIYFINVYSNNRIIRHEKIVVQR